MADALTFALCEALKELQLRHRAMGNPELPLKVPIITLSGQLKRLSPRIPISLRTLELGGLPSSTRGPTEPASVNNNNDEDDQNGSGSDDDGKSKLSKQEKAAKRRAEKETKSGSKSKKVGKSAIANADEKALSSASSAPVAPTSNFAVDLDFKRSPYKKSTAFLKEMATKSNGAYFTVPNDNEICVNTNKGKLSAADAFDIMRDHKRRFGEFYRTVHQPLVELEEEMKSAEEFSEIGGSSESAGNNSDMLEDESKATVTSITQFYGFTNSVNAELTRILTGKWRPADQQKQASRAATTEEADEEGSSDELDATQGHESEVIKMLAQTSGPSNAGSPTVLQPLVGLKGKALYNKAAILKNLKHYVLSSGLFYADDVPEEAVTNSTTTGGQQEGPINNEGVEAAERFPSLASVASSTPASAGPAWQRALQRREVERAAEQERLELAARQAASDTKEEEERKSASAAVTKKGPMMVHLDALLAECMRVSFQDRIMDMPTFFDSFTYRLLMPQTRILSQSPNRVRTLWIKGNLPTVLIKEKKRPGNRTVVYVVGLDDFGLSLRALAHRFKKEMACSVVSEVAPPALGKGTRPCLVLTGKLTAPVKAALLQLGVPPGSIVNK
eukprot:GILK01019135.1.p1 GENE.GILK01019135.1~~GILK01019135.1.p1  ORF type:complete len:727 (+),score=68.15 GILK01019135.1:330-2183(+)